MPSNRDMIVAHQFYIIHALCDALHLYHHWISTDPMAEFRRYKCCNRAYIVTSIWFSKVIAECGHCGLGYSCYHTPSIGLPWLTNYSIGTLPLRRRPWISDQDCEESFQKKIMNAQMVLQEKIIDLALMWLFMNT